jgi:hypothetical protein
MTSLRDNFRGFYALAENEWAALHADSLIALDASALLHSYRLSPDVERHAG